MRDTCCVFLLSASAAGGDGTGKNGRDVEGGDNLYRAGTSARRANRWVLVERSVYESYGCALDDIVFPLHHALINLAHSSSLPFPSLVSKDLLLLSHLHRAIHLIFLLPYLPPFLPSFLSFSQPSLPLPSRLRPGLPSQPEPRGLLDVGGQFEDQTRRHEVQRQARRF